MAIRLWRMTGDVRVSPSIMLPLSPGQEKGSRSETQLGESQTRLGEGMRSNVAMATRALQFAITEE